MSFSSNGDKRPAMDEKNKDMAEIWVGAKCARQDDGFACIQSLEVKTGSGACSEQLRDFLLCTVRWGVGSGCADQLKNLTDCMNPTEDVRPSPSY